MPVSSWSTSASSNATVGGVGIAENMARADVNNAIRALMAEAKAGFLEAPSVKGFGAVGDGVTDDTTAFTNALAAHSSIYVPRGTYKLTTALALDSKRLIGEGSDVTILAFTNATDGITIAASFKVLSLSGLQIRTASASGGKALSLITGSSGFVSDIQITSTGTGRWAFGIWANNWQTSNIYGVRIANPSSVGGPSATVGVHLEYGCNALNFFGLEVIGSSGAGTVQRAVEMNANNSLAAGTVLFEVYFIGCTFQGYFTKSLIYATGCSPIALGCHPENTNASPTDGADIWLDGTTAGAITNPKFTAMQGGSISSTGTIRGLGIFGGEMGAITIGAGNLVASVIGVRCASITDTGGQTTILGCSDGTGAPLGSVLQSLTHRQKISGTTVSGVNAKGFGYATGQRGTVTQATSKATGVTLNAPIGEITLNGAALAADTTVSFALTNSAIEANDMLNIQHVSGGTAGAYLVNALCNAGSATVNVRNITAGSLSEAAVLGFNLVKATIAA